MAQKGRYSKNRPVTKPAATKISEKKPVELEDVSFEQETLDETPPVGLKPRKNWLLGRTTYVQANQSNGAGKYMLFGLVAFFLSILLSALAAPLGVLMASIGQVTEKNSILSMLDNWFFPMLVLALVMAQCIFALLRRIWHKLEQR